jgi:hypothetical protein
MFGQCGLLDFLALPVELAWWAILAQVVELFITWTQQDLTVAVDSVLPVVQREESVIT